MSSIHVLDQNTIDKIAAGEVVERPASVVKELTENAIDAGATRITIEVADGGIKMIRITDDGSGISPDEIRLAFLRHATSKINSVEDLKGIASLGFRGEALSSIAAVSRVELITKTEDEITATRYVIEGGREKLLEEIGAPDGTTFVIRDIFYNTPARAKFLKTAMTEASHVGSIVEQLALSNPGIAFDYIVNGTSRLHTTGSGSLKDTIYHIYGRELASELLPIDYSEEGIHIKGFIAKPSICRGNRNFENYYVNGRYVKSRVVSLGIEDGYGNKLMQHQYPFTCLMITVTGDAVDVNVHPTKMDVRFSDERFILNQLSTCIKKALYEQEMIIRSSLNPPVKPKVEKEAARYSAPAPFEKNYLREKSTYGDADTGMRGAAPSGTRTAAQAPIHAAGSAGLHSAGNEAAHTVTGKEMHNADVAAGYSEAGREMFSSDDSGNQSAAENEERKSSEDAAGSADRPVTYTQQSIFDDFLDPKAEPDRIILGCAFNTYWIVQYQNTLFMIDQHAAHEKVLYCRFMRQYEKSGISSQMISPPVIFSVTEKEKALLDEYMEAFAEAGFELESFGGKEYKISAVPYSMEALGSKQLFTELLDSLEITQDPKKLEIYVHRVATEACKAAVKGGDKLSVSEARALINELFDECDDPSHCPHGSPTIISFTETELEKRFKRIV
ncbi:MAG: DNA mismatch repair endonuclease MutL [Lachnospiraceae bacterium]|nr:DNA mismatch repair endonuclease MutL [Lachnospiraceae bacterium]